MGKNKRLFRRSATHLMQRALKNLADRIVSYGTSIPDADTLFEQLKVNSSVRLFKITGHQKKVGN